MNLGSSGGIAMVNALDAVVNGGFLVAYTGPMPATPETAVTSQSALCTWNFSSTAFSTAVVSGGSAVGSAAFVSASVPASATGSAVFARAYASGASAGGAGIMDFTVGVSGADIDLNSTAITSGGTVTLSKLTLGEVVS